MVKPIRAPPTVSTTRSGACSSTTVNVTDINGFTESVVNLICKDMSSSLQDIVGARFYNTQARAVLEEDLLHLTETQRQDVIHLVDSFPMFCRDVPGRTNRAVHSINIGNAIPIKHHTYRYPPS